MKKLLSILLVTVLCLGCVAGAGAEKSAKDTLVIAVAGDIPSLQGAQNSRTTASLTWPTVKISIFCLNAQLIIHTIRNSV